MENDPTNIKKEIAPSIKKQSVFDNMKQKQPGQHLRPTFAFQSQQEDRNSI